MQAADLGEFYMKCHGVAELPLCATDGLPVIRLCNNVAHYLPIWTRQTTQQV